MLPPNGMRWQCCTREALPATRLDREEAGFVDEEPGGQRGTPDRTVSAPGTPWAALWTPANLSQNAF